MASQKYLDLLDKMKDLHIRKSAGYAGIDAPDAWANFRMSEDFGVSAFLGCLVRMTDKFIRIKNLVKNPNNDMVGESVRDTLFDLASYALIAICLWDETNSPAMTLSEVKERYFPEIKVVPSTADPKGYTVIELSEQDKS